MRTPELALPFLEVMVIRGCNLSCQGCTTFSDLVHKGWIPWATGERWLTPWIDRLKLPAIGFMGGEPLMNPEITAWIYGVRKLLPDSQIRFVTNGLLLDQHWHVYELLKELGNTVFKVSYHVHDHVLEKNLARIMDSAAWETVTEFGINRWIDKSKDFRFQLAKPKRFLKTFRNDYVDMMPHDSMPHKAFEVCVQQRCPLLFEGKIYKCGTVGLVPSLLERFDWPNKKDWEPFIVPGLDPACDEDDLRSLVDNFGRPHAVCRQCPTADDASSFVDHLSTVSRKKIKTNDTL